MQLGLTPGCHRASCIRLRFFRVLYFALDVTETFRAIAALRCNGHGHEVFGGVRIWLN